MITQATPATRAANTAATTAAVVISLLELITKIKRTENNRARLRLGFILGSRRSYRPI